MSQHGKIWEKAFKEGRQSAQKELLKEIDKFMEERKSILYDAKPKPVCLIKILPFEWEDFKKLKSATTNEDKENM